MRNFEEWIDSVPDEVFSAYNKEAAKKAAKAETDLEYCACQHNGYETLSEALINCFDWETSEDGHEYWDAVYESLREEENS